MRTAICLGGALELWDDLDKTRELVPDPDLIIGCNHAARDFEGAVDHWVTMHGELLPSWVDQRRDAGREPAGQLWVAAHRNCPLDGVKRIDSPGGSSGMLCVWLALQLECTHVILCGIPMHANGRHYDDNKRWIECRQYLAAWRRQLPKLEGRVKSWSGETQRMLGLPTREWLDAGSDQGTP